MEAEVKVMKRSSPVALIILLLLLNVSLALAHDSGGYSHDSDIGTSNPDWMEPLPDSLNISELSIPGTHDTMSFYGGDIVQCQSASLDEQLDAGIRVLDIRIRHQDNTFEIYHGIIYQHANFDEVLSDCTEFLAAHPKETILMRLGSSGVPDPVDNTRSFSETFDAYKSLYSNYIWQPTTTPPPVPTLGDVRGKIVILQDDDEFNGCYGLDYDTLDSQDEYHLNDNWDLYDKWGYVKAHIQKANTGSLGTIYINYLSGSGGSFPYFVASGHSSPGTSDPRLWTGLVDPISCGDDCYPDFPRLDCVLGMCSVYFEGTNELTLNYLRKGTTERAGIIMMDFPGPGIINKIIALNPWNWPPVADANGPYTVSEGSGVQLDGSASSDPDNDPLSYAWDFDNDGEYDDATGSSPTFSAATLDDGDHMVGLLVSDGWGGSDTCTTTVTVNNVAPTVTSTGETIDENGVATVSGTITDPGSQDTFTVEIDWGDGTPKTYNYAAGTTFYSEPHQYLDDNPTGTLSDEYDISVTVTDDDGGTDTAATTVTVNNVAPAVTATGDTVDENGVATVSGTITDPGKQDTFTVEIDWGEGEPQTYTYPAGSTIYSETHQYLDDNPTATLSDEYDISVTVTDDDDGEGTAATTVTVNNVAPVTNIDSITDENGAEIGIEVPVTLIGLTVNVAGSFTDVGLIDTHTASMDWDDGTSDDLDVVSGTTDTSHIYADPGDYTMTLAVTDDDTGVGTATAQITVVDEEGAIATTIQELTPLAAEPNIAAALHKLNGALEKLEEDKLEEDELNAGLGKIKQALEYLEAAEATDPDLDLTYIKGLLALTAKSVAVGAIEQAETLATKPNEFRKIEQAKVLVAEGDALRTAADYVGAVEKYQQAVRELPGIKLPK